MKTEVILNEISIKLKKYEDHFIFCPQCGMIIEYSGKFNEIEHSNCPWCTFSLTLKRKYK